jgi:hypothetical protein
LIHLLFNYIGHEAFNGIMIMFHELERLWREALMLFKILSQHLPGETEENHKSSVRIAGLWAEAETWDLLNV